VINFPKFLFGAYVPLNLALAALLLLLRRTRLVGLGMAGAMAVNFVLSSIQTITPPAGTGHHPNVPLPVEPGCTALGRHQPGSFAVRSRSDPAICQPDRAVGRIAGRGVWSSEIRLRASTGRAVS
jgi:hypothetical protein